MEGESSRKGKKRAADSQISGLEVEKTEQLTHKDARFHRAKPFMREVFSLSQKSSLVYSTRKVFSLI